MKTLARISDLKAREKDLRDTLKELEEERKALESTLPLGLVAEGDLVAEVKQTVRFNAAKAKENLSTRMYNSILVARPDAKQAKMKLTGEQYASCQAPVGISVTFKKD